MLDCKFQRQQCLKSLQKTSAKEAVQNLQPKSAKSDTVKIALLHSYIMRDRYMSVRPDDRMPAHLKSGKKAFPLQLSAHCITLDASHQVQQINEGLLRR